MPQRVLVADDHATFREKVRELLTREGFPVVAEAADGREALQLARSLQPDVAILDISMPVLDGLDAARQMTRVSPGTKIILLTVHTEIPYVLEAFEAGISGYVLKRRAAEELPKALRAVSEGKSFLCSIAAQVVQQTLPLLAGWPKKS